MRYYNNHIIEKQRCTFNGYVWYKVWTFSNGAYIYTGTCFSDTVKDYRN